MRVTHLRRCPYLSSVAVIVVCCVGVICLLGAQESRNVLFRKGLTCLDSFETDTHQDIHRRKDYLRNPSTLENHTMGDMVGSGFVSQQDQVCIHPHLDPRDPKIMQFDHSVHPVKCNVEEDWVYVDNGTFRISPLARRKYGDIMCEYTPLVRNSDFQVTHAEHIKPMQDGTPLLSDFFKVGCKSQHGKHYHGIHAGISYNKTVDERASSTSLPPTALGYDVLMFGFDSVSRMSWYRNLPTTRDYFVNTLGGLELEGYNILGDGTPAALLPILTGNHERDLPTARRGDPGSVHVDDFPWIWKDFRKAGYVTAWAEDMAHIGTVQLRLNGFKQQPVDHYMRTYFMKSEELGYMSQPYCVGSVPRHIRFMGWFKDIFRMYQGKRKFMFGFHAEMTHGDNNLAKSIDSDLKVFLQDLHTSGYLDRTILVMMSDHGSRFSKIRDSTQGKLEERLPYFAFRFPPEFVKNNPDVIKTFNINRRRLTTPFDIHETFHDILNFSGSGLGNISNRGISLFKEIPKQRHCADADVAPHWCACLDWHISTKPQPEMANTVISHFNDLTSEVSDRCARLALKEVKSIHQMAPNSQMLKFKQSADRHGDVPDFSDNMTSDVEYFLIVLRTQPGDGLFEVTVKHTLANDSYDINEQEISRINPYGDAPECISATLPRLRPYCYCL